MNASDLPAVKLLVDWQRNVEALRLRYVELTAAVTASLRKTASL